MVDPVWQCIELLEYCIGGLHSSDSGLRAVDLEGVTGGSDPAHRANPPGARDAHKRRTEHAAKMAACDPDTQHILSLAFNPEAPRGLAAYVPPSDPRERLGKDRPKDGSWDIPFRARVVLHCPLARSEHAASGSPRPLLEWLRHRAEIAVKGGKQKTNAIDRAKAKQQVAKIVAATAAMVAKAVAVYGGARTDGAADDTEYTVRGLVRASGLSAEAVLLRLKRDNVPRRAERGAHHIYRRDLDRLSPDLAKRVARPAG